MKTEEERFWPKVYKELGENACWLWEGGRFPNGYGSFRAKSVSTLTHRYVYNLLIGPIPKGLVLDHLCRVKTCVNPKHLEIVTPGENTFRGIGPAAKNKKKTHCLRGHSLSGENLLVYNGKRKCRECDIKMSKAWEERQMPPRSHKRGEGKKMRVVIVSLIVFFLIIINLTSSYAQLPPGCTPTGCTGTDASGNPYDLRNYSNSNDPAIQGGGGVYSAGNPYGVGFIGGGNGGGGNAQMGITGTVMGNVFNGLGFFGAGELAVKDATTRIQTTIAAVKTAALLVDALLQARMNVVPWNSQTEIMLRQMGLYGLNPQSILYGGNTDASWTTLFTGGTPLDDGTWLDEAVNRDEHVLLTQQQLLHLISWRNQEFENDSIRIHDLESTVESAEGRNAILRAQGAIQAEGLRQQQMAQQIALTQANLQAVEHGAALNERMAREGQERAFLRNFDRPPPEVVFTDTGL